MRILNACSRTCYEKNGCLEKEILNDNSKITKAQFYNCSIE
jgi:hypothetical protein